MTNNLAKSIKIDPHTGEISIMCDDRTAFNICVLDGHSIEIRGGDVVKDGEFLYDEKLSITPWSTNVLVISKMRYE